MISKWKVVVFFSRVKCECLPSPKVTKFTFYNISSSLLMLSAPKLFLVRQKYVWFEKKKFCFDGKPKMTKNLNLKIWKSPKWPFPKTLFFTTKFFFFCKKKFWSWKIGFCLVRMFQKAVYPSAGRRAPKFWASSFPWKFFLTFFWKKFENWKTNTILFSKMFICLPEYWKHHILKINY